VQPASASRRARRRDVMNQRPLRERGAALLITIAGAAGFHPALYARNRSVSAASNVPVGTVYRSGERASVDMSLGTARERASQTARATSKSPRTPQSESQAKPAPTSAPFQARPTPASSPPVRSSRFRGSQPIPATPFAGPLPANRHRQAPRKASHPPSIPTQGRRKPREETFKAILIHCPGAASQAGRTM
jgi:hypothetical protein